MSKCLVTGGAGFIGSHLCERLLDDGHKVCAVDAMHDHREGGIDRQSKNFNPIIGRLNEWTVWDLAYPRGLENLLEGIDYVFHLAATPGVRESWGDSFEDYDRNNVLATQRLLEACVGRDIKRFVYASSSSIYGDALGMPWSEETTLPSPQSPYGVTKLAGEHLCRLYAKQRGVPTVCLRYFTVYGPRQRPDMAFYRFMRALIDRKPITVYGDGEQTRDFTYVADAVDATIRAMRYPKSGAIFNVGGGSCVTVMEALKMLWRVTGESVSMGYLITHGFQMAGDVRHTLADNRKIRSALGWEPKVSLEQGLRAQWEWMNE